MYALRASVFPLSRDCTLSDRSMTTMGMGRERKEKSLDWKKKSQLFLYCFVDSFFFK